MYTQSLDKSSIKLTWLADNGLRNRAFFLTITCIGWMYSSGLAAMPIHEPILLSGKNPGSKIISFVHSKAVSVEPDWKLEKDAGGVQVYVRPASGSAYRQVKAVTKVACSLGGMVTLIKDDAASPQWMDRIVKYQTLQKVNEHEWYTYAEIGIPWPFKNADVITRNVLNQNENNRVTITIENTPDFIEKYKDKARVLRAGGSWVLTPQTDGSLLVEYIFQAKPEGLSLPAWLVNAITIQSFHRSVERLHRLAETDQYRQLKLVYVKQ